MEPVETRDAEQVAQGTAMILRVDRCGELVVRVRRLAARQSFENRVNVHQRNVLRARRLIDALIDAVFKRLNLARKVGGDVVLPQSVAWRTLAARCRNVAVQVRNFTGIGKTLDDRDRARNRQVSAGCG